MERSLKFEYSQSVFLNAREHVTIILLSSTSSNNVILLYWIYVEWTTKSIKNFLLTSTDLIFYMNYFNNLRETEIDRGVKTNNWFSNLHRVYAFIYKHNEWVINGEI